MWRRKLAPNGLLGHQSREVGYRKRSAVIKADSQSEPFWNWLRLPHHDTGIRYEDEAGTVSGVVIEFGNI